MQRVAADFGGGSDTQEISVRHGRTPRKLSRRSDQHELFHNVPAALLERSIAGGSPGERNSPIFADPQPFDRRHSQMGWPVGLLIEQGIEHGRDPPIWRQGGPYGTIVDPE